MNWNIRAVPDREAVLVRGGNRLCGELTVQGAKKQHAAAAGRHSSVRGETVLHNCPALSDVHTAVTILRRLGCRCTHTGDTLTVCADGMTRCDIPHSLMREMRSSIVFLGAILSRCGEARLSFPGGCELGPRPIDQHLEALRSSLAQKFAKSTAACCAPRPAGCAAGSSRLRSQASAQRKPAARRRPRQGHNGAHKRRA